MSNLFLVGMPGAGKTTIGRTLAKRLGMIFSDSDKELVDRTGVSIATIFEIEGEAGFRVRWCKAMAWYWRPEAVRCFSNRIAAYSRSTER